MLMRVQSVKAFELRKKNDSELLRELADLKTELSSLRVQKVSSESSSKVSRM